MKTINGVEVFSELEEILNPAHTALLIVDMQNDGCLDNGWFAQNGKDVTHIQQIFPQLEKLLQSARSSDVMRVFVEQTTLPHNLSDPPAWLYFKTRDGRTRTDYTIDGTWGQQTIDLLKPTEGEVIIRKNRPSAFFRTNLDVVLRAKGIKSVLVTGTITQGCVLATILEASFNGFYTVFVPDCVQSYSQELHGVAIQFLKSRYDSISSDDAIELWGKAGLGEGVAKRDRQ